MSSSIDEVISASKSSLAVHTRACVRAHEAHAQMIKREHVAYLFSFSIVTKAL